MKVFDENIPGFLGSSNSIEVPLAESSCLSERATAGAEFTSAA